MRVIHESRSGNKPSPHERLRELLRSERRDLGILVVYGVFAGLLFLVIPIAIQAIVNTVGFGLLLQPLLILATGVVVGLLFAGALQAVQTHIIELIQRRIFVRVAGDLAYRLPRTRREALDHVYAPELVNRFFDVLTVQKSAAILLFDGMTVVIQSAIGLVFLALYHPVLLGFDIVLIVALLAIFVVLGAGGTKTAIDESKTKYAVAAWLEEIARHPMTFRSSGGVAIAADRADQLTLRYLDARESHFRVVFRQILGVLLLQALVSFLLLAIGGFLVTQRELSLGQLVAAEFIVTVVTAAFAKLGKQIEVYYDLLAAMDKLGRLTDLPLEQQSGSQLSRAGKPLAISLHDVTYAYDEQHVVLRDLNLQVGPREHIAVTGIHGAGKSTFLDLLYGLRQPTSGSITVDGVNLRELAPSQWREQVEVVREIEVFEGSVFDNVRLGRIQLKESDVREALKAVALEEAIAHLPEGLHTTLSTGGAPLSPGQARRLMVARAIAARPRLLLLDEALGHLDPFAQEATLNALFAPDVPWTLVAVTYNPDAVRRCQRVFSLRDGRLVPTELGASSTKDVPDARKDQP